MRNRKEEIKQKVIHLETLLEGLSKAISCPEDKSIYLGKNSYRFYEEAKDCLLRCVFYKVEDEFADPKMWNLSFGEKSIESLSEENLKEWKEKASRIKEILDRQLK